MHLTLGSPGKGSAAAWKQETQEEPEPLEPRVSSRIPEFSQDLLTSGPGSGMCSRGGGPGVPQGRLTSPVVLSKGSSTVFFRKMVFDMVVPRHMLLFKSIKIKQNEKFSVSVS